jgi:hypothetical protein
MISIGRFRKRNHNFPYSRLRSLTIEVDFCDYELMVSEIGRRLNETMSVIQRIDCAEKQFIAK